MCKLMQKFPGLRPRLPPHSPRAHDGRHSRLASLVKADPNYMKMVFLLISQIGLKMYQIASPGYFMCKFMQNLCKFYAKFSGAGPLPHCTRSVRSAPRARDGCHNGLASLAKADPNSMKIVFLLIPKLASKCVH